MHYPDEVHQVSGGKNPENIALHVKYRNYKGDVAVRRIIPLSTSFRSTEYHPEKQWILFCFDLDRRDWREYALRDIQEWIRIPVSPLETS